MALLEKISRHLRRGTLVERVMERAGILPEHVKVRWRGADNERQAVRALARWAQLDLVMQPAGSWVLSVGDNGAFHRALNRELLTRGILFRTHTLEEVISWNQA